MRFFFIVLFYTNFLSVVGQVAGAEQTAMAGCSLTNINAFSSSNSIASTSFLQNHQVGLHYNNFFLLPELSAVNLSFVQVLKHSAVSYKLDYAGLNSFNTIKIGLGYSRILGKNVSIGLRLNYHRLHIKNENEAHLISFDLGAFYKLSEKINFAISIRNPAKQKIEKVFNETLKTAFALGASYLPNDRISLSWEIQKDLQFPLKLAMGFAYNIHPSFIARSGVSINPLLISGGIGLIFKNTQLDISSTWDAHIGYSPQISISYAITKVQE